MTITVEVGATYHASNGSKVGPMMDHYGGFIRAHGDSFVWEADGTLRHGPSGTTKDDWKLVAVWTLSAPAQAAPMTKALLLDTAKAAVADRGLNYGRPEDNFERIANLWNAHLANRYADRSEGGADFSAWDGRFDAADVAQMMVLMKVARLENQPAHLDSWTDIAGYAACGAEITSRTKNSS